MPEFTLPDLLQGGLLIGVGALRRNRSIESGYRFPWNFAFAAACSILDRPAFNRTRLKAEKSIGSRVLEQLIRVQVDAGCSRRVEI